MPFIPSAAEVALPSEWTTITKTIDESVSSSTVLQDDDELSFTSVAGGQYEFELVLIYASPAGAGVPDLKIGLGEDGTLRGPWQLWYLNAADSSANTLLNVALGSNPVLGTATTNRIAKGLGTYFGTGGVLKLQWAQGTSDPSATILRAGSLLRIKPH